MSSNRERETRNALLLNQIEQQRLDLSAASRRWFDITQGYDRGWNALLSLRSWALIGSGIMAIWSIRHPRFLFRWGKRGFAAFSTWRLLQKTLHFQQRH